MNHKIIDDFNAEGVDRCDKTRQWYKARLTRYLDFLAGAGVAISSSGPAQVKQFLAKLRKEGLSWSTRNGSYTALQQFYQWAVLRGHVEVNPFEIESITRPRKPRRINPKLSLVSVQQVLDVMRQSNQDIRTRRDYALLLLFVDSGLRRMEAVGLNVGNVNLQTGLISVLVAKGDNQRWARISQPTIEAIQSYLRLHPHDQDPKAPLFLSFTRAGYYTRLSDRRVNGILRDWSDKARLPDHIRPHDLRRLFASHFSAAGGGSKILQTILGHTNLETTEGYILNGDDEIIRQHKRFSPVKLLRFDQERG